MAKVSITARIDQDMADKIEASGMGKTEVIEKALSYFFENCPNPATWTATERTLSEAAATVLRDSITPYLNVLHCSITDLKDVIQKCNTDKKTVIQKRNTPRDPRTEKNESPGGGQSLEAEKTAGPTEEEKEKALNRQLSELLVPEDMANLEDMDPKNRETIRQALALVSWTLEIQRRQGGNIKTALKRAGPFSDKKYYARLRLLESNGIYPKSYLRK